MRDDLKGFYNEQTRLPCWSSTCLTSSTFENVIIIIFLHFLWLRSWKNQSKKVWKKKKNYICFLLSSLQLNCMSKLSFFNFYFCVANNELKSWVTKTVQLNQNFIQYIDGVFGRKMVQFTMVVWLFFRA